MPFAILHQRYIPLFHPFHVVCSSYYKAKLRVFQSNLKKS
nr:MAG TPA: hypothetical protein [Caudoviricetes sp.]